MIQSVLSLKFVSVCPVICSVPSTHAQNPTGSKGNVCFCQGFAQLSQHWSPRVQDFPLCPQPPWKPWTCSWKQLFKLLVAQ